MTYEIETDDVHIEYELRDESFDHAFGTHRAYSWDIISLHVYIPLLGDMVDMTHTTIFDKKADELISKHIDSLDTGDLPSFMR